VAPQSSGALLSLHCFRLRLSLPLTALVALAAAGCSFSSKGLEVTSGDQPDAGTAVENDATGDVPVAPADRPVDQLSPDAPTADKPRPPDAPPDGPTPLGLGIPCTAGGEPCMTGFFCVDGFCCENACAGACQACAASKTGGANGRCRPVSAGTDPDGECADDGAPSCKRDGQCDGAGSCALYARGTACGAPSCAGSALTGPPTCDGGGTCQPTAGKPCVGGFVCASAQACKTACTGDGDCAPPLACDTATGFCSVMKKAQGQPCADGPECASGTCADGVCCDRACGGRCRACLKSLTGAEDGTCADIMAGVRPTRPAECPMQRTTCGNNGLCNGAGACQQFPDGTQCGTYCCGNGQGQGSNSPFCHLQCQGGACTNQTGAQAGTCDDSNPCTRDRCDNNNDATHTCTHDMGCSGLLSCCCVGGGGGGGGGNFVCADPTVCTISLGHCAP
jgi:hypothetical protein